MKCRRVVSLLAILLLQACGAWAQEEGATEVLLTPLEMTEPKNTIDHITQTDMERKTATNLWEALRGVQGVYLQTTGARNEGTIGIRGSNRYQVGMYIDDIPIATAYRNEWDYNNTLTYGLESVDISKGYSSPLLASNNNLAGVVNLRTAKPKKEFEFSAKYLNFFDRRMHDQGRMAAASIGTRQEFYYLKGTFVYDNQDFFTLPEGFDAAPYQGTGRRKNSDHRNLSANIIGGWTPSDDVDIMVGYMRQSSKKGQPFDAAEYRPGADGKQAYPFQRSWYWPEYETSRLYANANFNLSRQAHLKAVMYYDSHQDKSESYTDIAMTKRDGADKKYDQYTVGGQLTFDYAFNAANKLALSAGYRILSHKEYNDYSVFDDTGVPKKQKKKAADIGDELDEHISEGYWDLGAEYTLKPIERLTLVFGASLSTLTPMTLESRDHTTNAMNSYKNGLDDTKTLFNYQVGAFYDLTEKHEIFATFAKKSRFATMRERFLRIGDAPANPDLNPEHAYHYELGYKGLVSDWLKLNTSVYYSDVSDMITSKGVKPNVTFENLGRATFYGFEAGAEAVVNQYFSAGAVFNYMRWNNCTNDNKIAQLPEITSTLYGVITPLEGLSIIPQLNISSGFYWNTSATDVPYRKSPNFATADIKAVYDINKNFSVEAGVKNVFDQEYAYSAYYPEPGRSYFVGVSANF